MSRTRVLNALVLADILTAFSTIGSELFFGWTLPRELQRYTTTHNLAMFSGEGVILTALWSMIVCATLVAWVGLLNLWRFARALYLGAWIGWLGLLLVSGPSVSTPLAAMFSTIQAVVGGAILGLVYFSDLSRSFERPTAQVTVAA